MKYKNMLLENVDLGIIAGVAEVVDDDAIRVAKTTSQLGTHMYMDNELKLALGVLNVSGIPHTVIKSTVSLEDGRDYKITGTVVPVGSTVYLSTSEVFAFDSLKNTIIKSAVSDSEGKWTMAVKNWNGDAMLWVSAQPTMMSFMGTEINWTANPITNWNDDDNEDDGETGGDDWNEDDDWVDDPDYDEGDEPEIDLEDSVSGSSESRGTCPECEGLGLMPCPSCGGYSDECDYCHGEGYIEEDCSYCDGRGEYSVPCDCDNGNVGAVYFSEEVTTILDQSTGILNYYAVSRPYELMQFNTYVTLHRVCEDLHINDYKTDLLVKQTAPNDPVIDLVFDGVAEYIGNYSLVVSGGKDTKEEFFFATGTGIDGDDVALIIDKVGNNILFYEVANDDTCYICGGSGERFERCESCDGYGYHLYECPYCDSIPSDGGCDYCNYTGEVECELCSGSGYECLAGETLITLHDNTYKRLDELYGSELLLGSDGLPTKIIKVKHEHYNDYHILYTFDDGTVIDEIHDHRFYNVEQGFWQYLKNWKIGEHAIREDGKQVALIDIEKIDEQKECFGVWTECGDYFANGLLSGETAANQRLLSNATIEQAVNMINSLEDKFVVKLTGLEGLLP